MRKTALFLMAFLCAVSFSRAQNNKDNITLTGKVVDK